MEGPRSAFLAVSLAAQRAAKELPPVQVLRFGEAAGVPRGTRVRNPPAWSPRSTWNIRWSGSADGRSASACVHSHIAAGRSLLGGAAHENIADRAPGCSTPLATIRSLRYAGTASIRKTGRGARSPTTGFRARRLTAAGRHGPPTTTDSLGTPRRPPPPCPASRHTRPHARRRRRRPGSLAGRPRSDSPQAQPAQPADESLNPLQTAVDAASTAASCPGPGQRGRRQDPVRDRTRLFHVEQPHDDGDPVNGRPPARMVRTAVAWRARRRDAGTSRGTGG
jgi:hypothetical protein